MDCNNNYFQSAVVCQRVGQLSVYDPDLADIGELHYIASDGMSP